ncbi:hypothetical protein ACLB1S_16560 [Escherichia coli]
MLNFLQELEQQGFTGDNANKLCRSSDNVDRQQYLRFLNAVICVQPQMWR